MKTNTLILTCAVAGFALSGCVPALIGAGATTGGVVAAQERTAGNAVDDAGIKLTINNLFIRQDINDLFKNVAIHVTEGRVLLTGDVDKPESKVQAVGLAWKAAGVREVIDEIQVNDQTGVADYARDAWIASQIRMRLLLEKNLRSVNYNVEVVNNVVYLMGIAQNQDELAKATYIASTTKYVKQVVSHVVLKDDPRRRVYGNTQDVQNRPIRSNDGEVGDGRGVHGQSGDNQDNGASGGDSYSHGSGQPESYHRGSSQE